MHSGQTRAVLERKARAGVDNDKLQREKRMGDLAWQMNVASVKLRGFRDYNETAEPILQKLYDEAKAEYDCLKDEVKTEEITEKFGPLFG